MFYYPGGEFLEQLFATSTDLRYVELKSRLVWPETWEELDIFMENLIQNNDAIHISSYMYPEHNILGHWYRSKETIS